jgi:hypothetical protein
MSTKSVYSPLELRLKDGLYFFHKELAFVGNSKQGIEEAKRYRNMYPKELFRVRSIHGVITLYKKEK